MTRTAKVAIFVAALFAVAAPIAAWRIWPEPTERTPLDANELVRLELMTGDRIEPFGSDAALIAFMHTIPHRWDYEDEEEPEWLQEESDAESEPFSLAGEPAANVGAIGVLRAMTGSWNGPTSPYASQTAGILEGDIVGVHGDHLVVLRRGRLFSVLIGGSALRPLAMVDVPPRGTRSGWYDEMLVSGDTIVVLGYSYEREGTELSTFRIDDAGAITPRYRFYLRSNDYYSSRNYATRLIGSRLLMYVPIDPSRRSNESTEVSMPGWRSRPTGDWRDLVAPAAVFRPIQPSIYPTLHTVIECDLASETRPSCSARSILGPESRVFYVSSTAVYVWVGEDWMIAESRAPGDAPPCAVYRLPLDGGPPTALRTWGMPIDQFSFHEEHGRLYVLVRAEAQGDAMFGAEASRGAFALLSAPLSAFDANVRTAERGWYTELPRVGHGDEYEDAIHDRFVGRYLVYAAETAHQVVLHPYEGGRSTTLRLSHDPERIEIAGDDAIVIGRGERGLTFTTIDLEGTPAIDARGIVPGASQTETRSHAFYFRGDGVLGLPIAIDGRENVTFFRLHDRRLTRLGELGAIRRPVDDHCVASCTDWYGSGRPLFIGDRVLALMGYDLVEGAISGNSIREIGHTHLFLDR